MAKPRILTPAVMEETLADGGWVCTGGAEPLAKRLTTNLSVFAIAGRPDGSTGITVADAQGQNRKEFILDPDDFTVTSPELHLIHINRIFPQKQQGRGGVEREVPQLGVWLKFFNPEIKNRGKEKRQRQQEDESRQAIAAHKRFLDELDVVGKTLEDITFVDGGTRAVIAFDDGTELEVFGSNIGFQRLIRGDAVSRAYAEEADFDN